jgi:hypothetical protein
MALPTLVDPVVVASCVASGSRIARRRVRGMRRFERDGTVVEVYAGGAGGSPDLRPYRGRFGLFLADEAMLWAAILLEAFEADDAGRRPWACAPDPCRQRMPDRPPR